MSQPLKDGGWVATHEDVTALHRREQELARTRTFLNTVIDNVPAAISVKNADDLRYVLVNRAGEEIYGLTRTDDRQNNAGTFPDRSMETIEARDRAALEGGIVQSFPDHIYSSPTKGPRIHSARRVPVLDENGKPLYLLLVIQDLTEQREAEAARRILPSRSPDRPAQSRRVQSSICTRRLRATPQPGKMLAVMCVNFDHFKDINDVYGNAVGDELLKVVAERFTRSCGGRLRCAAWRR